LAASFACTQFVLGWILFFQVSSHALPHRLELFKFALLCFQSSKINLNGVLLQASFPYFLGNFVMDYLAKAYGFHLAFEFNQLEVGFVSTHSLKKVIHAYCLFCQPTFQGLRSLLPPTSPQYLQARSRPDLFLI